MDLETVYEGIDSIHLAQDAGHCQTFVNMLLYLRFP
jgi:hypothetical protein